MKSLSVIIQMKATEQNVLGTVYSAVQGGSYFIVHGRRFISFQNEM